MLIRCLCCLPAHVHFYRGVVFLRGRSGFFLRWPCGIDISQSGWGVCAGWEGDLRHALPAWYEETAPLRPGEPDAVVINLGTNDAAAIQAGFISEEQFEEAALRFLDLLRGSHPRAKLVWAYGMLGETLRPQLERIVERFGDAYYLPLPVMTEETAGSRQHPGPVCHQAAARTVARFLKKLLS